MKLYTYYTDSHSSMFNDYLKKYNTDLELIDIDRKYEQVCPTGEFRTNGWAKSMSTKLEVIIDAIKSNFNDIIVFSDVDVQFFGPIKEQLLIELGEYDIAFQNDYGSLCAGFFICKCNEKTLNLFETAYNQMLRRMFICDQPAINANLRLVSYTVLSKRFWTFGENKTVWEGQEFEIPNDILVHHANYTIGIDNKLKLLNIVREKYNKLN